MNIEKKYVYGFLTIIVFLLVAILFKSEIQSYFNEREMLKKNQARSQEVLKKAKIFNIAYVMRDCFNYLVDKNSNAKPGPMCNKTMNSYDDDISRWESLINENRDVDCRDFSSKIEAQNFYEYINGEYAYGFYAYWSILNNDPSQTTMLSRASGFEFGSTNAFDGHCKYDPYGLDTNSDCNACENLK